MQKRVVICNLSKHSPHLIVGVKNVVSMACALFSANDHTMHCVDFNRHGDYRCDSALSAVTQNDDDS